MCNESFGSSTHSLQTSALMQNDLVGACEAESDSKCPKIAGDNLAAESGTYIKHASATRHPLEWEDQRNILMTNIAIDVDVLTGTAAT